MKITKSVIMEEKHEDIEWSQVEDFLSPYSSLLKTEIV